MTPDVDLPGQDLGAFILQKLFKLVHEDDEVERIETGFDQVVGLHAGEVVACLQDVKGRVRLGGGLGNARILFARELGTEQ